MRNHLEGLLTSVLVALGIALALLLWLYTTIHAGTIPPYRTVRALVLEKPAITYIDSVPLIFQYGDSVWVNMATHRIDDTTCCAMICKILNP